MSDAAEQVPPTPKRTVPPGMIPWKPGQSGNPKGINAVTGLMSRVRAATDNGELLIRVLKEALEDRNKSVRLKAVEILFERGWGRAMQQVSFTGERPVLDLSKMSPEKVEAFMKMLLELMQHGLGSVEPPSA